MSAAVNIYRDSHSGGWIVEIRDSAGRRRCLGVYGARAAALAKVTA